MPTKLGSRVTSRDVIDLARKLGTLNEEQDIQIDCSDLRFFELTPMTLLLGFIMGWRESGKRVGLTINNRIVPYMQRMDFFKVSGVTNLEERFKRRSSNGRFVEFATVDNGHVSEVDRVSSDIADCIAPDLAEEYDPDKNQFHQCVQYSVSELLLNSVQHSKSPGFVGCQHYGPRDSTQIAIVDHGIGVRESFKGSRYEAEICSDEKALELAVSPMVSSKASPPGSPLPSDNMGVGLTILRELALKSGGHFVLISGNAAIDKHNSRKLSDDSYYAGTFAAFEFRKSVLSHRFNELLELSKIYLDQKSQGRDDIEELFQ